MTTFKKTLLLVSMALGLGACGPDGGGSGKPDAGTCTPATPSQAAQQVIGSWRVVSSTTNCTCSDGTNLSGSTDGTDIETFTAGCEPDQIFANDSKTPCPETCTVSGTTVTCDPFSCETSDGSDLQSTMDVYTLSGGQLFESGAGTLTTAGRTCQCASTDGVLNRIQ